MNNLSIRLLIICFLAVCSCKKEAEINSPQIRIEIQDMFDSYVEEVNTSGIEDVHRFFSDAEEFYWVEDGVLQYPNKTALIEGIQAFSPSVSSVNLNVSKIEIIVINEKLATLYVQYTQEVKLNSGYQFTLDGAMTILTRKEDESWKFFNGHSSVKKPRGKG